MAERRVAAYWNHNTAFHGEILKAATSTTGAILDIGCGDGLLLDKLRSLGRPVVGNECDEVLLKNLTDRFSGVKEVEIVGGDFASVGFDKRRFGFISMVAVLHHLNVDVALDKCAELLGPGGRLLVVGIGSNRTFSDFVYSALSIPIARLVGLVRKEYWPSDVPTEEPVLSFDDVKQIANRALPGSSIRRRRHFRFTIVWTKPLNLA